MLYDADELIQDCLNYKRNKIRALLKKCTPKQRDMFNRMYKSVDSIPEEKMDWAIKQIVNTLNSNSSKLKSIGDK